MRFCDLHMHSTASDGTFRPAELAAHAKAIGLEAIALTDHDTTAGLEECARACEALGIDFVPGIELSADPKPLKLPLASDPSADSNLPRKWGTLHILGLFVRDDDPLLLSLHERVQKARGERNPQVIKNLQDLGIDIEYSEVQALALKTGTQVIGRPHIAQVLVDKGVVADVSDAFARYIGEGRPAFARKDLIEAQEGIHAIHHAGGFAVLAHPIQLRYQHLDELAHILALLKSMGLDGIEIRHVNHTPQLVELYSSLARQFGLITTGGSDFHGTRKAVQMGSQHVPIEEFLRLRAMSGK